MAPSTVPDIERMASPAPSDSVISMDDQFSLTAGESSRFDWQRTDRFPSTFSQAGMDLSQLNLVSLSKPWNAPTSEPGLKQSFHGLAAVLSHPSKRPAPLRASRVPLPSIPPPEPLPKVSKKDFEEYLKVISPEWDRFEKAQKENHDPSSASRRVFEAGGDSFAIPIGVRPKELLPLNTIPQVFFEPEFNLGNPHTFDVVTETVPTAGSSRSFGKQLQASVSLDDPPPSLKPLRLKDDGELRTPTPQSVMNEPLDSEPTPKPEDVSTNQLLQDKMSYYLDIVEQHLVLEISRRSASFFAALTNLQDLESESSSCLSRIESLRNELDLLDDNQAKKGLSVIELQREVGRLKKVDQGITDIRGIEEAIGMIKNLVGSGYGYDAVDIWEEVESWLSRKGKREEKSLQPPSTTTATSTVSVDENSNLVVPPKRVSSVSPKHSPSTVVPLQPAISSSYSPQPPPTSKDGSSLPPVSVASGSKLPPLTPALELSTLSSLSHLPSTLSSLSTLIAVQLESELQSVLQFELNHPSSLSQGKDGESNNDVNSGAERFVEKIRPLVEGLLRVRSGEKIVSAYKEVAIKQVREAIHIHMPLGHDPSEDHDSYTSNTPMAEKTANLARKLKDMEHSEFLVVEKKMFKGLLDCIQLLEKFAKGVEGIVEKFIAARDASNQNNPYFPSVQLSSVPTLNTISLPKLQQDLSDVLSTATELANSRASKVVGIRNDKHSKLKLPEFLEVFNEAWLFVVSCEIICRKMIVGLRGTMVVQAKTFLQTYHSQRTASSARLVENELWAQVEIPASYQHAVNLIVEAAVTDPPELVIISSTPPSAPQAASDQQDEPGEKLLKIEDKTFFAVSATLEVLMLLVDYVKIIINVEILTTDAMSKTIEYLKSFNSRTCQVVLGAGAMRSAGLKNITAKHLALASQSLSITISLIPYIRETLRRHLNSKQAVMLVEFDKLKRDYQEHQNEIHSKLVAIMADRLVLHTKSLQSIDFEQVSKHLGKPNEYIELLVKETTQLHKILSKYLPQSIVEAVMSQVFASMNHALSLEFGTIEVKTEAAKERMLIDVSFLVNKLTALPNITPISKILETLVKDKQLPRRPLGQSMRGLMRRSSSQGSGPKDEEAAPTSLMVPEADELIVTPDESEYNSPQVLDVPLRAESPTPHESVTEAEITSPAEENSPAEQESAVASDPLSQPIPSPPPSSPLASRLEALAAGATTESPKLAPEPEVQPTAALEELLPTQVADSTSQPSSTVSVNFTPTKATSTAASVFSPKWTSPLISSLTKGVPSKPASPTQQNSPLGNKPRSASALSDRLAAAMKRSASGPGPSVLATSEAQLPAASIQPSTITVTSVPLDGVKEATSELSTSTASASESNDQELPPSVPLKDKLLFDPEPEVESSDLQTFVPPTIIIEPSINSSEAHLDDPVDDTQIASVKRAEEVEVDDPLITREESVTVEVPSGNKANPLELEPVVDEPPPPREEAEEAEEAPPLEDTEIATTAPLESKTVPVVEDNQEHLLEEPKLSGNEDKVEKAS